MKWILFFLLGIAMLHADQTPSLYRAIGDPLYTAADGYRLLVQHKVFDKTDRYEAFVSELDALKEKGLLLDVQKSSETRRDYVRSLRHYATMLKGLDAQSDRQLDELFTQKAYEKLALLSDNPYSLLKNHIAVKKAALKVKMQEDGVDMANLDTAEKLYVSLEQLKEKLIAARLHESAEAACLNDITAMNYWMLKAEEAKQNHAYCEGFKACEQITEFMQAARVSCGEDAPAFQYWRERSSEYRNAVKMEFAEICR